MQLSDIISVVNNLLDEDGIRRPPSVITDTVNEGYNVVAVLTQSCERTKSYLSLQDSLIQSVPSDFYTAVSVYHDGTRLYPIRLPDLDDMTSGWISANSGTPLYYTTIGALTEAPQMWLYPAPSSAGTLRLTYAGVPDPLVYDADVPEFPRDHHYVLVWWTYAWELLKERSILLANKAFQTYSKFVEEASLLQQYVYRRTPDRDWVSPPLDAEAVRRKMVDLEQALPQAQQTIEPQVLAQ